MVYTTKGMNYASTILKPILFLKTIQLKAWNEPLLFSWCIPGAEKLRIYGVSNWIVSQLPSSACEKSMLYNYELL